MNINQRINAFAELGSVMRLVTDGSGATLYEGLNSIVSDYHLSNPWFTPESTTHAIKTIGDELTKANLEKWIAMYPQLSDQNNARTIAVIMAGNIPAVGFHDMLCVLITGNNIIIKASSKDEKLLRELSSILCSIEPAFISRIHFTDDILKKFDAIIATGSDNSTRYFEYYFGKYPNLIRGNRTGVAMLTGNESGEELKLLGEDVFTYYGLGCRSMTKLFVPHGFDMNRLLDAWKSFSNIISNKKYTSNYEYHKAVMIVNNEKFIDGGFFLLKKEKSLFPPVSVLFYEEVDPHNHINTITHIKDKIQVITGEGYLPFGFAQKPKLWDYSDNIDTISFLTK